MYGTYVKDRAVGGTATEASSSSSGRAVVETRRRQGCAGSLVPDTAAGGDVVEQETDVEMGQGGAEDAACPICHVSQSASV